MAGPRAHFPGFSTTLISLSRGGEPDRENEIAKTPTANTGTRRNARIRAYFVAVALVAGPATAPAQELPGVEEVEEARAATAVQRAELSERLDALRRSLAETGDDRALAAELRREIEFVERIDRLQADQQAAIHQADRLARAHEAVERKLAAGPAAQLSGEPPYRIDVLDAVWDALDAQRERLALLESAVERAASELDTARDRLEAQERERRAAKEKMSDVERLDDEAERARRRRALHLAELESQLAASRRELSELQAENAKRSLAVQAGAAAVVNETVSWVEKRLAVSPEDLDARIEDIEGARFDLERALDRAKNELAAAERRFANAQERAADAEPSSLTLAAELDARQQQQRRALRRVEFLERKSARLDTAEDWWRRRFRVLGGEVSNTELRAWKLELAALLEESQRARRLEETRLIELRNEGEGLRRELDAARAASRPETRWLAERERQLAAVIEIYASELQDVGQSARLLERTRDEIDRRDTGLTAAEQIAWMTERGRALWQTELIAIDDRPITAGKIATALALLLAGFWLSRRLSSLLGRTLRRRAHFQEGAAAAFQSLLFYVLVITFLLVALRTANIPLTVFTIAGGALAIGIGFGSQNLVNNFISGLILLVERPIKVGDLVHVEGTEGWVDEIGARSTIVRTFDNTNIIVPNSKFLETNVVNWTLVDPVVRTHVDVGVAYGSDLREVARILEHAVREHGQVLADPAPFVRFMEFGESALQFRSYFWLRMGRSTDRLRIQSDLRFRIDHLFRDAGIEIAFPQRDLHLRSAAPLHVEVAPRETSAHPGGPRPAAGGREGGLAGS